MSTILIVDDERDMVELLADELTARGHNVLAAYDGDRGIELAGSQPDLVILDIMMPGRDGFEVCRAIRDTVRCPILFVSARQSENDRVKGFSLGGDDYIVKPLACGNFLPASRPICAGRNAPDKTQMPLAPSVPLIPPAPPIPPAPRISPALPVRELRHKRFCAGGTWSST